MEIYLSTFFRTVSIMLILLFLTVVVMGKKSIGELPVFDTLVVIVLGSVVGAVIVDQQIQHMPTIFAVILLAIFERIINTLSLKYNKLRRKISFEPSIVIQDGKILFQNVKKNGYSLDDILMLIRQKNVFDIDQIQYGIIEANGDISILKRPEFEICTLKDMNIKPSGSPIPPLTVIVEGIFQKENIGILKTSEQEIMGKLVQQGFNNTKDIFYASMDGNGRLSVSPYK